MFSVQLTWSSPEPEQTRTKWMGQLWNQLSGPSFSIWEYNLWMCFLFLDFFDPVHNLQVKQFEPYSMYLEYFSHFLICLVSNLENCWLQCGHFFFPPDSVFWFTWSSFLFSNAWYWSKWLTNDCISVKLTWQTVQLNGLVSMKYRYFETKRQSKHKMQ